MVGFPSSCCFFGGVGMFASKIPRANYDYSQLLNAKIWKSYTLDTKQWTWYLWQLPSKFHKKSVKLFPACRYIYIQNVSCWSHIIYILWSFPHNFTCMVNQNQKTISVRLHPPLHLGETHLHSLQAFRLTLKNRIHTPLKFNMEPEKTSLEKVIPFGNHHFQVPC